MRFWVWLDGVGVRSSSRKEPDETQAIKGTVVTIKAATRSEAIATYRQALALYSDWLRGRNL